MDPPRDPSPERIIDEMIVRTEEGLGDLARAGDDLTGAARVRALGAYLKGLDQHFRLLQKAGRVPTEPGQFDNERDIARAVEVIHDVFERYAVPVEARREIRGVLDGGGRALEAG